ncbi:acyl-CoA thioester hydrolase [Rhizobium binae]|uniref:Acyl-CoA thioester hydrolase n=1 Tax=Rhizobium binae TaxID=1138190 RepID=A0ABV2MM27_9HYPH|nr:thioesterase family protein [Rhizobium binae]NKL51301.1 acyl-CoA thioesterase [Rhizobium leguminosarum bv. viciae]MBX4927614.1 acyl-CoA thioesterase [Rhizobium binae]MBX4952309.1 acyl-CoA thioesterase [Rhizobium binae]MBX4993977.1 acyl-CoA thioesterase [Rhizobium binae]QSY83152.1 acyl-CoA thioesterase [Rhizobium binae]
MSQLKRPGVTEIRVPFRDVDMTGRMFLASYISYAESVVASFWLARPEIEDEPIYSASKVTCFLHRPLHYDEPAIFTAAVDKIGVRSIGFLVSIDTGEERAAEVEIIWQASNREDQQPASLPEETRDWLYRFLD